MDDLTAATKGYEKPRTTSHERDSMDECKKTISDKKTTTAATTCYGKSSPSLTDLDGPESALQNWEYASRAQTSALMAHSRKV